MRSTTRPPLALGTRAQIPNPASPSAVTRNVARKSQAQGRRARRRAGGLDTECGGWEARPCLLLRFDDEPAGREPGGPRSGRAAGGMGRCDERVRGLLTGPRSLRRRDRGWSDALDPLSARVLP